MAEFDYFNELKTSLEEAVEHKEGKRRCRTSVREIDIPEYPAAEIARLRLGLKLSQRSFAGVLGVSSRTVEAWEAGRNAPSGTARNLMYLLQSEPGLIDRLIVRRQDARCKMPDTRCKIQDN